MCDSRAQNSYIMNLAYLLNPECQAFVALKEMLTAFLETTMVSTIDDYKLVETYIDSLKTVLARHPWDTQEAKQWSNDLKTNDVINYMDIDVAYACLEELLMRWPSPDIDGYLEQDDKVYLGAIRFVLQDITN